MHIAEIISIIELMAPLQGAASWDVSGLQVAAHRTDATRLAVCLDPSPASVSGARAPVQVQHPPSSAGARFCCPTASTITMKSCACC